MAKMQPHHNKKLLFLIVGLIVLLAGMLILLRLTDQPEEDRTLQQSQSSFLLERKEYQGKTYVERTGITSILLMGVDRTASSGNQTGYRSGGQADFLLLVVMDSVDKKVSLLQINRDTIADIVTLGVLGNKVGTRSTQICLSHAYGANQLECGQNTVDAVKNLLEGIELTQFYSMNMSAMPALNDLLGGVTVTMADDYPDIDPSYVKGATIKLTGAQAYEFVHDRMNVEDGTNARRMLRQRSYMQAAQKVLLQRLSNSDSDFINKLYDTLGPDLTTNITRGQLINEAFKAAKYNILPVVSAEGTFKAGADGHLEFHADKEWIVNWVLNTFYRPEK